MTTTHYIWDEENDSYFMETDGDGNVTAVYTNEPVPYGRVISQRRGNATSFYHYDGQGSTRQLTDESGNVTDEYTYSAFGETVASSGAIVAKIVGTEGFGPFKAMGAFIVAVILALLLQAAWYLLRIRFFSWVRPMNAVRGMRDALVMAFSTASSTVTMPVTYACLTEKVGVREKSASMGALVGANFNNDGTALYEAMSALFISQLIGHDLTLVQQLMIVLTSIIASVGAAGIPQAGLVTMTLVFTAVGLPLEYIPLLLTVDWFLDRCRTTINVLGDVNVSCLLDGRVKPAG